MKKLFSALAEQYRAKGATDGLVDLDAAAERAVRDDALRAVVRNIAPLRFLLIPMIVATDLVVGARFDRGRMTVLYGVAVVASITTILAVALRRRAEPGDLGTPRAALVGAAAVLCGMAAAMLTWVVLPGQEEAAIFSALAPAISLAVGAVSFAGRLDMFSLHHLAVAVVGSTGMWMNDNPTVRSLGILVWVLALAMVTLHIEASRSLLSSLRLQFASARLRDQLADEREALAEANEQLRSSNERLEHLAQHDPLTGLLNRRGALDALERLLVDSTREVGVLFIDLDHFKAVNDLLGHRGGDEFLATLADRLCRALDAECFVGRIGGDEFVVVLPGHDAARGAAVASRLADVLSQPVHAEGRAMPSSASIGVAAAPEHGGDAADLLRHANAALFQAKRQGRNRMEVFDGEMLVERQRTAAAEQSLRRAIDNGDILPFFQPEIDATTGRVIGAELLARWIHPDGSVADAMDFIDIARRAGLLERLTEQVLSRARPDIRRLVSAGLPEGFRFRVNLAPASTDRAWRYQRIDGLVRGLDPELVTVDVRESALLNDLPSAAATLASFRARGGRVCLEDFARGVSSLAMLRKLPIDEVRIDRTSIDTIATHPNDRTVVRAVIALVRELGLAVTADGIETGAQADTLIALGCVRHQGFLYAPALSTEQFEHFLLQRQAEAIEQQIQPTDTWSIDQLG